MHEACHTSYPGDSHDHRQAAGKTHRPAHALSHAVELPAAEGRETGEKIRALAILAEQNEVRVARTQAGNEERCSGIALSLATVLDFCSGWSASP